MQAAGMEEPEKCGLLVWSQVKDGVAWTCWRGCSAVRERSTQSSWELIG